jgi:hypothetical protein
MVNKSRLEDLEVYKISLEISNKVWNLVILWDNFSRNNIGSQLLRSIDSVELIFPKDMEEEVKLIMHVL